MTRNQFEYLFKLATDNDRSNYQVSKWAIVQLDDYFYYGANDKTIAIAATIGSMSSVLYLVRTQKIKQFCGI